MGKRRGRIDDHVEAYKRRLELYRELTLPMLKTMDEQNRLKIVDGDSDNGQVMKELRRAIHREVAALRRERAVESIDENGTTDTTASAASSSAAAAAAAAERGGGHGGASGRTVRRIVTCQNFTSMER